MYSVAVSLSHFFYQWENVCYDRISKNVFFMFRLGLATLLNSHSIHRTRYHSIGLSIRMVCPGNEQHCTQPEVELSQVIF